MAHATNALIALSVVGAMSMGGACTSTSQQRPLPDGVVIVYAARAGILYVLDGEQGDLLRTIRVGNSPLTSPVAGSGHRAMVLTTEDSISYTLRLLDLDSGSIVDVPAPTNSPMGVYAVGSNSFAIPSQTILSDGFETYIVDDAGQTSATFHTSGFVQPAVLADDGSAWVNVSPNPEMTPRRSPSLGKIAGTGIANLIETADMFPDDIAANGESVIGVAAFKFGGNAEDIGGLVRADVVEIVNAKTAERREAKVPPWPYRVLADANHAYVVQFDPTTGAGNGMTIINIDDPTSQSRVGLGNTISGIAWGLGARIFGIDQADSTVLVFDTSGAIDRRIQLGEQPTSIIGVNPRKLGAAVP